MDNDQLRAYIERQESRAQRTDVAGEQAQAMDYYLRRPFGNEEEGRSQVISSDVWDVVEGMTPQVIEPFVSSSDAVVFNPQGPEDEEAARQETDYLNYVVTQRNDSFTQFLAMTKAGLLQKNGVVKYWWDKTRQVRIEVIYGLGEDELAALLEDESITVLSQSQDVQVVETPEGPKEVPVFDVKIRHVEEEGFARYEVVPPEEFLIIGRDPNPQNAWFVQHRQRKTLSDLREMGYDVPDDLSDAGSGDATMEVQSAARHRGNEWEQTTASDGNGDPSMKEVWYRETICRVDYDDDGVAELRKVCLVGTNVLANDEVEEINFAAWTPYQQLFQFDGRCPADEAIEVQEVKSTLQREMLNNVYTINNNRVFAGKHVNLDDLIDNQIGGIVRVDSEVVGNQVVPAPVVPIGQVIQPAIEYMDSVKENRTGFTRYNQGSSDLNNQKTLGEVRIVSQMGSARLRLIQRSLAEQGIKPLMMGLHRLIRRHATKPETIRLRGKWVTIDPRSWKRRMDMTVSVGLGTNDKMMELQSQGTIIQMQKDAAMAGVATPENVYNAMSKFVELSGEKNPDKYFTHPSKVPPKKAPDPMQDPEFMIKVADQKNKAKKTDAEIRQKDRELDQRDAQLGLDTQNARIDALERHQRLQMDTMNHRRDMSMPHSQELAANQQAHSQQIDLQNLQQAEVDSGQA